MEKIKDISTEMRNPQMWWDRYHGYGQIAMSLTQTK